MFYGLNYITSTGLTLRSNHRGAFINSAQGFSQISCPTDKWYFKFCFINMIPIVRRCQNLALIDVINPQSFQDLRLNKMAYSGFSHHWNGNGLHNLQNNLWIRHSGHTALSPYISWDSL